MENEELENKELEDLKEKSLAENPVEKSPAEEALEKENHSEDEDIIDSFKDDEEEIVDLSAEKLNEMNKLLPEWSIEPPHNFLNKK